jgi:hypothetical protein
MPLWAALADASRQRCSQSHIDILGGKLSLYIVYRFKFVILRLTGYLNYNIQPVTFFAHPTYRLAVRALNAPRSLPARSQP